jgi:perosamine synthetase
VIQALLDQGIAAKRGVMCTHRTPAYATVPYRIAQPGAACECPAGTCSGLCASERAEDRSVMLPLFPNLSEADQDRIVDAVSAACGGAR